MVSFFATYWVELVFSILTTCTLGYLRVLYKKSKSQDEELRRYHEEQEEKRIMAKLEPIYKELEELREYIRKLDGKHEDQLKLILASYRFRLTQLCREFLVQGYLTQSQYDQLLEFYKVYHGLGGNGMAEEIYHKVIALEVRPDEF